MTWKLVLGFFTLKELSVKESEEVYMLVLIYLIILLLLIQYIQHKLAKSHDQTVFTSLVIK